MILKLISNLNYNIFILIYKNTKREKNGNISVLIKSIIKRKVKSGNDIKKDINYGFDKGFFYFYTPKLALIWPTSNNIIL